MVFFTCNACGQAVKRGQVEKHYQQQCRNCDVLSCVDCGKDFRGDAYLEHTKCISEEEKYSGKDYKAKANANKGEKKQDAWLESVLNAINNADAHPKVKGILLQIKHYPNIPRKRQKFENFLKNCVGVRDTKLIAQAWDRINSEIGKEAEAKAKQEKADTTNGANGDTSEEKKEEEESVEMKENGVEEKKLSKREKKEERRKQSNKKEKKDKNEESHEKKSKKRKLEEIQENGEEEEISKKKKKKKKKRQEEEEEEEQEAPAEQEEEVEEETMEPRPKFKWDAVILEVLQKAKGNEISMKKLRKKVVAEYMATGGDGKCTTEDMIVNRFYKKLMKKDYWTIFKDTVKLNQD